MIDFIVISLLLKIGILSLFGNKIQYVWHFQFERIAHRLWLLVTG